MTEKKNLYQKISAVMKDVEYLSKDGQIKFKTTNYKAITEEKVTSTVRESLIKNGLVILPIEQSHKREGTLTTVDTKYKIVCVDTKEYEIITSSGTGVDSQDKGVGKAMTYSYKYLLLRTFAIPTGDDPDKVSSAELDDEEAKRKASQQKLIDDKKPNLLAKWKTIGGKEDVFDKWFNGELNKGVTVGQMEDFLTTKVIEKKGEKSK